MHGGPFAQHAMLSVPSHFAMASNHPQTLGHMQFPVGASPAFVPIPSAPAPPTHMVMGPPHLLPNGSPYLPRSPALSPAVPVFMPHGAGAPFVASYQGHPAFVSAVGSPHIHAGAVAMASASQAAFVRTSPAPMMVHSSPAPTAGPAHMHAYGAQPMLVGYHSPAAPSPQLFAPGLSGHPSMHYPH
jgi:hypothetical protein